MQITKESTGNLTATLCIELEKADYEEKVNEKLREYRKKMKMPGFREGKVPLGVVNKMYGKAILAEEINEIISESLASHLEKENISLMASPLPNKEKQQTIDFDTQDRFAFYFDIAMRPELDPELETLEGVTLYEIEADEEKTQEYLQHILRRYGDLQDVDQATDSSLVRCAITQVDESGQPVPEGIQTSNVLSVDKISDEEIRKEFVGAEKEKTIVMDPMKAFDNNLAEVSSLLSIQREEVPEEPTLFSFAIESIKDLQPAKLDEKLMAEVFPSDGITTEEEFMARIRQDIVASYAREAEYKMVNEALKLLSERTTVELPDEFLKRWLIEGDESGSITMEEVEEGYEEYSQHLKLTLLRNSLYKKYQLTLHEEDYFDYVKVMLNMEVPEKEEQLESYNSTVESIVSNIKSNEKQHEQIRDRIMEGKLTRLVVDKVPHQKKQTTTGEFDQMVVEEQKEKETTTTTPEDHEER